MIYKFNEHEVQLLGDGHYVAPSADVIGQVIMGDRSSVWFNAVVRGDNDLITIGERCNVQDGCVLHVDPGYPLTLEPAVSIGHMAMLHGCHIGENTLVGINSVILNNVRIGKNCIIGANSFIAEGKEIPDGSMVIGSPGRVRRALTEEEITQLSRFSESYMKRAVQFRAGALVADPRF